MEAEKNVALTAMHNSLHSNNIYLHPLELTDFSNNQITNFQSLEKKASSLPSVSMSSFDIEWHQMLSEPDFDKPG